jgi:hypothetical protein
MKRSLIMTLSLAATAVTCLARDNDDPFYDNTFVNEVGNAYSDPALNKNENTASVPVFIPGKNAFETWANNQIIIEQKMLVYLSEQYGVSHPDYLTREQKLAIGTKMWDDFADYKKVQPCPQISGLSQMDSFCLAMYVLAGSAPDCQNLRASLVNCLGVTGWQLLPKLQNALSPFIPGTPTLAEIVAIKNVTKKRSKEF